MVRSRPRLSSLRSLHWLRALKRKFRHQVERLLVVQAGRPLLESTHPVRGVRFLPGGFCTSVVSNGRWRPSIAASDRHKGNQPDYDELVSSAQSSDRARRALGVHVSDYLMRDFLERYRREILAGKKVRLELPRMQVLPLFLDGELEKQIYGPIIDRYFKKKPISFSVDSHGDEIARSYYELSFDKRRVREALGLSNKKQ